MPDFWQFATVSMGLGPLQAIYQARYMRYLHDRGLSDTSDRKVWGFLGDGEVDEPESLAGLALAAREKLDNLIFVVNANLQRLDGPVRATARSSRTRGRLPWCRLERHQGVVGLALGSAARRRPHPACSPSSMGETLDGDYQTFKIA